MKIIQVNDVHTSDRPPRYRIDSYKDDIFSKLNKVAVLANMNHVDGVLFTGDLFHSPHASRVSHKLVNDWMHFFDYIDSRIFIVPGNHDMSAGRVESLDKQPIGTLFTHPKVTALIDGSPVEVGNSNQYIAGLAWNYGVDANYIKNKFDLFSSKPIDIVALHAPIATEKNPYFDTIQPEELEGLGRVVCYGHIHTPAPVLVRKGMYFSNPGALSRRSLGGHLDSEASYEPSVAIITVSDGGSVDIVYKVIPHRPAADVFRQELHDSKIDDSDAIREFISQLASADLNVVTPESLSQKAQSMTENPNVKAIIEDIVLNSL